MGRPKKKNRATLMYVDGTFVDAIRIAQNELESKTGFFPPMVDASAFVGKTFIQINEVKKKRRRMQLDKL